MTGRKWLGSHVRDASMNLDSFSLILQNNDVYYFKYIYIYIYFKNNNNDAYIWILKLLSLMIGFIELVLEKNGRAVFPSIQVTGVYSHLLTMRIFLYLL